VRSISSKAFFGILAGLIFVIALIGVAYVYEHQRTRMREVAATDVGGDPRRGSPPTVAAACSRIRVR